MESDLPSNPDSTSSKACDFEQGIEIPQPPPFICKMAIATYSAHLSSGMYTHSIYTDEKQRKHKSSNQRLQSEIECQGRNFQIEKWGIDSHDTQRWRVKLRESTGFAHENVTGDFQSYSFHEMTGTRIRM